jgi:hypothetical protein
MILTYVYMAALKDYGISGADTPAAQDAPLYKNLPVADMVCVARLVALLWRSRCVGWLL